MTGTEPHDDGLAAALRKHTGCEVRFDYGSRKLYSTDASIFEVEPIGVAIPRTADDLRSAVQIALEHGTSIVPRGGGTSLSGQSIGPGLVVDCSKYLNHVLDVDVTGRKARVQPGVVLDQLNRQLAPDGLLFGPEVATASRANIGGMIGNNSAGSRSVVYGKTGDHVASLDVLLSDGSQTRFEPISLAAWERKAKEETAEGRILHQVRSSVEANAEEIRRRFPNIIRRVSGYNLLETLASFATDADGASRPNLIPLLVGSEGTLGFVAEAELSLVPKPAFRGLVVPHFTSLRAALDSLATCLEAGPSAVELMDAMLIGLAANNRSLREVMKQIVGMPAALLMVEFSGDDEAEVSSRIETLRHSLLRTPGVTAAPTALDAASREPLWNMRSAAVPLLYGMHGDRKPATFVEDTAVDPAKLPEFADRFREVLLRHETDGAFYGHAAVGCLHIRPVLNLKDPADVRRMRAIMVDISDLVLEFGGCLSGEHGDGLVRSEWNRKMYGPIVYETFCQVKRAFDPRNLFNPGKVVDAPAMTDNLRLGEKYKTLELPTVFDYSAQEGFFQSIELCNGSGVCRKLQGGVMCPSYRATRDERDTTRGRANALRIALQEGVPKPDPMGPMADRWVFETMDLCLMCKACKSECPSNVDVAKLKSEFLHAYYERHSRPMGHWLVANIRRVNGIASRFTRFSNWVNRKKLTRWLLERLAGIDRRRSLPPFVSPDFRRWFDARRTETRSDRIVHLLDDCFTTYHEPAIGQAAVRVLEAAGCKVNRLGVCCGRSMISKGYLAEARSLAQTAIPRLDSLIADGSPILGLEPSCLLTLADEWPELVPGPPARRVAEAARLAEDWLSEQVRAGRATLPLQPRPGRVVLRGHCHQKALCGTNGTAAAMGLIPELEVETLATGCCGMAGSFGFEHFDISAQIAELDLLPALRMAPGATIAATGTSCRHQIHDLAGRLAKHPLEILADALQ